MPISDIMTRAVRTCAPDDTLHRAADLMWTFDCGCLPVVNRDGTVVGLITDRDVCMAAYTQGRPIQNILVSEAMANEVYSCLPDDTVSEVEEIMRARRVRRVPVVDLNGKLVGLVSLNDLAREAARQQTRKTRDLGAADIAATLAAICQPRTADKIPATT
jgi:CBS domain-containing protein